MPELRKLRQVGEVDDLLAASADRPVWIFKHSLTCGASSGALAELEAFLSERPDDDPALYAVVEIQRAREVSAEVARRTGVRHQSPQVLLVSNGEVVWDASHWRITAEELASRWQQVVAR